MGWRQVALGLSVFAGAAWMSLGCSDVPRAMGAEPANARAAAKPNIIVILADDLGYADIGAQGLSKDVKTPNIDSIAAAGVRFTNGYVSCPVCSPTRAGFLTGRYQERFGHEMNPGPTEPAKFGLPLDQITLPQVMKKAGYATAMVGKWHEGTLPPYHPTARGFDEYFGFLGGAHSYMKTGAGKNALLHGTEPVDEKEYFTDAFSREAVSYIDRHKEGPFFLYLAYNAIHNPQEVTEKYLARFPNEKDPKRRNMLAMLSAEDDGVGRVLETLKKNHLEENTLVFFFSDNGGPTEGNGSRNTPLSGYKGQVWEGGIRIPFMAQWKGQLPEGKVLNQPVIQLDIFATAAKLGGATMPADRVMDGKDLMPLMMGKTDERPHENLYWRFGPQRAIRSGDLKLVKFQGKPDRLFDLSKDLSEKHDISDEKPEDARRLAKLWDAWSQELKPPLWKGKDKFQENLSTDSEQMGKSERRAAKGGRRRSPASQQSN